MKAITSKIGLLGLLFALALTSVSCEKSQDNDYTYQSVDREEVERPGDQRGVDREEVEKPGEQGNN